MQGDLPLQLMDTCIKKQMFPYFNESRCLYFDIALIDSQVHKILYSYSKILIVAVSIYTQRDLLYHMHV